MKKYIIAFLLFSSIFAIGQSQLKRIGLAWKHSPSIEDVDVYLLYHSTNMSIPMVDWELIATIPKTETNYFMDIVPGKHFFTIQCSNFWGITSDFSNVASTPALPGVPTDLKITRQ